MDVTFNALSRNLGEEQANYIFSFWYVEHREYQPNQVAEELLADFFGNKRVGGVDGERVNITDSVLDIIVDACYIAGKQTGDPAKKVYLEVLEHLTHAHPDAIRAYMYALKGTFENKKTRGKTDKSKLGKWAHFYDEEPPK